MIVILGGAGYLLGPLIGAVLFIAIPEVLRIANELRLVVFGVVLVLMALYAPRGVCGLVVSMLRRVRCQRCGSCPPSLRSRACARRSAASSRSMMWHLAIAQPGIYGLIGPNGAGKTTLFDVICGRQEAEAARSGSRGNPSRGCACIAAPGWDSRARSRNAACWLRRSASTTCCLRPRTSASAPSLCQGATRNTRGRSRRPGRGEAAAGAGQSRPLRRRAGRGAVLWPAAAAGDRLGADRATASICCSTSRPPGSTRRCSTRCATSSGASTTSGRSCS